MQHMFSVLRKVRGTVVASPGEVSIIDTSEGSKLLLKIIKKIIQDGQKSTLGPDYVTDASTDILPQCGPRR